MEPQGDIFSVQVGPRRRGMRLRNGDTDGLYWIRLVMAGTTWHGPFQTLAAANTVTRDLIDKFRSAIITEPTITKLGVPAGDKAATFKLIEVGKRYWLEGARKWYVRPERGARIESGYIPSPLVDDGLLPQPAIKPNDVIMGLIVSEEEFPVQTRYTKKAQLGGYLAVGNDVYGPDYVPPSMYQKLGLRFINIGFNTEGVGHLDGPIIRQEMSSFWRPSNPPQALQIYVNRPDTSTQDDDGKSMGTFIRGYVVQWESVARDMTPIYRGDYFTPPYDLGKSYLTTADLTKIYAIPAATATKHTYDFNSLQSVLFFPSVKFPPSLLPSATGDGGTFDDGTLRSGGTYPESKVDPKVHTLLHRLNSTVTSTFLISSEYVFRDVDGEQVYYSEPIRVTVVFRPFLIEPIVTQSDYRQYTDDGSLLVVPGVGIVPDLSKLSINFPYIYSPPIDGDPTTGGYGFYAGLLTGKATRNLDSNNLPLPLVFTDMNFEAYPCTFTWNDVPNSGGYYCVEYGGSPKAPPLSDYDAHTFKIVGKNSGNPYTLMPLTPNEYPLPKIAGQPDRGSVLVYSPVNRHVVVYPVLNPGSEYGRVIYSMPRGVDDPDGVGVSCISAGGSAKHIELTRLRNAQGEICNNDGVSYKKLGLPEKFHVFQTKVRNMYPAEHKQYPYTVSDGPSVEFNCTIVGGEGAGYDLDWFQQPHIYQPPPPPLPAQPFLLRGTIPIWYLAGKNLPLWDNDVDLSGGSLQYKRVLDDGTVIYIGIGAQEVRQGFLIHDVASMPKLNPEYGVCIGFNRLTLGGLIQPPGTKFNPLKLEWKFDEPVYATGPYHMPINSDDTLYVSEGPMEAGMTGSGVFGKLTPVGTFNGEDSSPKPIVVEVTGGPEVGKLGTIRYPDGGDFSAGDEQIAITIYNQPQKRRLR